MDAKLNTISVCDWDGRNRNLILYSTSSLRHPFSITTFEDWLYWTDWDRAAVFRANKFTGKDLSHVTAIEMVQVCFPNTCKFGCLRVRFVPESYGNTRLPPLPSTRL